MKLLKNLLLLILIIFIPVSCGSKDKISKSDKTNDDGLDTYRKNGQLIDLSYDEFDQMLTEDKSFVFFLKRNGCASCAQFYPEVANFFDANTNLKLYALNLSELGTTQSLTISSYYIDALGKDYYINNQLDSTTLYTPTISKVYNGELIYVNIGVMSANELSDLYQDNYYHLNTYYSYNKKVQNKNSFNLFISKMYDKDYDDFLRQYFKKNDKNSGIYLDCSEFAESEQSRLLNRINYYLSDNRIEKLPDYFYLRYENGEIINFQEVKMNDTLLDELYKNKFG